MIILPDFMVGKFRQKEVEMKKVENTWLWFGFVGLGAVLVTALTLSVTIPRETVLRKGARVYFEAKADTLDGFSGRYIKMRHPTIQDNIYNDRFDPSVRSAKRFYAVLKTNEHGIAKVAKVVATPPEEKDALYLRIKYGYYASHVDMIHLWEPFNCSFYIPRKFDPVAEAIYAELSKREEGTKTNSILQEAWIYRGEIVTGDLLLNGTPILHVAAERLTKKEQ